MRALWSGMISFGLVNIPVKVYSALDPERMSLRYLHAKDLGPIQYRKVCARENIEVPTKEIVRGYEYEKDEYVTITDEELSRAAVEKSQAIEVNAFVDYGSVDFKMFEKPYYLAPDNKGAHRPYALFREALHRSGKVGIGTFMLRTREHLVMLKADGSVIVLDELRYPAVIRSAAGLSLPSQAEKAPQNQLDLAMELIVRMSEKPEVHKLQDTFQNRLKSLVEQKLKGKPAAPRATVTIEATRTGDIMEKLKASLESVSS